MNKYISMNVVVVWHDIMYYSLYVYYRRNLVETNLIK